MPLPYSEYPILAMEMTKVIYRYMYVYINLENKSQNIPNLSSTYADL